MNRKYKVTVVDAFDEMYTYTISLEDMGIEEVDWSHMPIQERKDNLCFELFRHLYDVGIVSVDYTEII